MNAIALKHHPIMDGQRLKPGYTLDPLKPLCYWHYDEREEDEDNQIIFDLWEAAREIVSLNEFDLAGDFEKHTYQINIGSFSWYVNALKAYRIKLCKAYKLCSSPFNSFKDWCEKALGCTVSAINTRIRAAWAVSFLIAQGFDRLPKSPSVAHELSKLDSKTYYVEGEGQFCQLFDIWCEICHKYADHEITLEKIKEMIGDPLQTKPEMKQIRIPASKYELLFEQAAAAGTTPNALLNLILENYLGDKTDDGLRTTGEDSIPCEKEWLCSDPEESNPRYSSGDLPYTTSGPIQCDNSDEKREGTGNGNPSANSQEPQSKEPDSVTDFKAIAQIPEIETPKAPMNFTFSPKQNCDDCENFGCDACSICSVFNPENKTRYFAEKEQPLPIAPPKKKLPDLSESRLPEIVKQGLADGRLREVNNRGDSVFVIELKGWMLVPRWIESQTITMTPEKESELRANVMARLNAVRNRQ